MANDLLFGNRSAQQSINIKQVNDVESITDIHLSSFSDSVSSKSSKSQKNNPVSPLNV